MSARSSNCINNVAWPVLSERSRAVFWEAGLLSKLINSRVILWALLDFSRARSSTSCAASSCASSQSAGMRLTNGLVGNTGTVTAGFD